MMKLKFDNSLAQAWFRTRLNRTIWKDGTTPDDAERLMNIRLAAYGPEVSLFDDEIALALSACENYVGDDETLAPARQAIVDQLKEGLK